MRNTRGACVCDAGLALKVPIKCAFACYLRRTEFAVMLKRFVGLFHKKRYTTNVFFLISGLLQFLRKACCRRHDGNR